VTFDLKRAASLPSAFDWREQGGCTPIKDQGHCGSCWAFGTVGPLECAIKIKDGVEVDLSEQWLVSCNKSGWSCSGGFWAHDYHQWKTDRCGGTGAVMESDFPYVASDAPCNCPYPHEYTISSWAYIGNDSGVPPVDAIKQAIMDYGPVSVAVYVDDAFQAYTGGVFNACADPLLWTNHAVVLVGWGDSQGTNGVWFLRNSWGTGWGEGGYMRIEYDCSAVGDAACYVHYEGRDDLRVTPDESFSSTGYLGGPFTPICKNYTLANIGASTFDWTAAGTQTWLSITPKDGTLSPGSSTTVDVCVNSSAASLEVGTLTDTVEFTNTTSGNTRTRGVTLEIIPRPFIEFPLDTDPGWAMQSNWSFGQPTGGNGDTGNPDPTSGHTGSNVYGNNLSGGYPNNLSTTYWLTTGAIDCSSISQTTLKFWRWLNVENNFFDHAYIEVSRNGSTWTRVWENPDTTITDSFWTQVLYDISTIADGQPTVYIRWGIGPTDSIWTFSGWNIDDVALLGAANVTPTPTITPTPTPTITPTPTPTVTPTSNPLLHLEVNSTAPKIGEAFWVDVTVQPINQLFDAWGIVFGPGGVVYSFIFSNPATLYRGGKLMAIDVPGLTTPLKWTLFRTPSIHKGIEGSYTIIGGLVPAGLYPTGVGSAIPGYVDQEKVEIH
jgi:hypothetical protein